MREVIISYEVWDRMDELFFYLVSELKLSEEAAFRKTAKMRAFIRSLSSPVNHAKCRFKLWRNLGYRCAIFEKSWIFAYEDLGDEVIVRDMKHTAILKE
jgi:hypothetical protein